MASLSNTVVSTRYSNGVRLKKGDRVRVQKKHGMGSRKNLNDTGTIVGFGNTPTKLIKVRIDGNKGPSEYEPERVSLLPPEEDVNKPQAHRIQEPIFDSGPAMITIRMSKQHRDMLKAAANDQRMSLNQYMILAGLGLQIQSTLQDALHDIAEHGCRHDTNPTVMGSPDVLWWYDYIRSMDRSVRDRAREALEKFRGEIAGLLQRGGEQKQPGDNPPEPSEHHADVLRSVREGEKDETVCQDPPSEAPGEGYIDNDLMGVNDEQSVDN